MSIYIKDVFATSTQNKFTLLKRWANLSQHRRDPMYWSLQTKDYTLSNANSFMTWMREILHNTFTQRTAPKTRPPLYCSKCNLSSVLVNPCNLEDDAIFLAPQSYS